MEIKNNSLVLIILAFIIGYCLPQLMNNMCGSRRVKYFEPSAATKLGAGGSVLLAAKGVAELMGGGATDTASGAACIEGGCETGVSEAGAYVGTGLIVDGGSDVATGVESLGSSAVTAGGSTLRMMEGLFGE